MSTGPSALNLQRAAASGRRAAEASASPASEQSTGAFPKGFVRRLAIVHRLIEAGPVRLALIVAPAGYGKSTLLSEWAEHDERQFVSLALEDQAAHAAALTVTRTMRSLRRRYRSFVLVVDDAHAVPPTILREAVKAILTNLPQGSTVALASRAEPPLPMGRLRAHRALVEVRARDLAMAPAEAAILLRGAGLELEFGAVQTLVGKTEGWPAGLFLAALSLREHADPTAAVPRFGADAHVLAEFIREEVLSALPTELRSFSIRTSVVEDLSGQKCDAVLGAQASARVLAKLAALTQLLVPLDGAHERYRWHTLVRGTLRGELRLEAPELETQLHRRASAWYDRHGDIDAAIEHAVCAGDVERAGDLIWPNILAYVTRGRSQIVQRWLSAFTTEQISNYPPLALSAAHGFLASGGADQAQHWALAATGASRREAAAPADHALATGIAVIEAMAARGGAVRMEEAAKRAYDLEGLDSPWRAVLCLLRGIALHLIGARSAARQLLDEGAHLSSVGQPSVQSLCLAQTTMISIEQQDWELATDCAARARAVVAEQMADGDPISALVFAASAAARAHQGSVDAAKYDLRRGTQLLATLGDFIPWYGAEARILLAHASIWLADIVGARTLLADASRLARRVPDGVIFEQWFDEAWAYMDTFAETKLAGPSSLTIAELRILRFLPSHRSFREIAQQLGVSANTVKTQAHAVYRKLGAASRSEAVERALDAGLLGQ
jgi:LuxR family transcriptional regulator, maltose regulon positive regulatory protein